MPEAYWFGKAKPRAGARSEHSFAAERDSATQQPEPDQAVELDDQVPWPVLALSSWSVSKNCRPLQLTKASEPSKRRFFASHTQHGLSSLTASIKASTIFHSDEGRF